MIIWPRHFANVQFGLPCIVDGDVIGILSALDGADATRKVA